MRLAIADPPYPMQIGAGNKRIQVASRWYGDNPLGVTDVVADVHPDARAWDDDATHRALLEQLLDEFDGWAIATSVNGLRAYGILPPEVRIMAWVKPNAQPGAHRLRSLWEPVLVYPAKGRRSNRIPPGRGQVPDVLVEPAPRVGFRGAKPPAWTRWVLDALSYDPNADELVDMFPGSGAVTAATEQGTLL